MECVFPIKFRGAGRGHSCTLPTSVDDLVLSLEIIQSLHNLKSFNTTDNRVWQHKSHYMYTESMLCIGFRVCLSINIPLPPSKQIPRKNPELSCLFINCRFLWISLSSWLRAGSRVMVSTGNDSAYCTHTHTHTSPPLNLKFTVFGMTYRNGHFTDNIFRHWAVKFLEQSVQTCCHQLHKHPHLVLYMHTSKCTFILQY